MKILVAYDGSKCSEAALDDLRVAGLPHLCEAHVISVAEVWLRPISSTNDFLGTKSYPVTESLSKRASAGARTLANHAKKRLERMFPRWQVTAVATCGSPAKEILSLASKIESELIVVGSHGRSWISRFFLGSVSQRVLTEAACSVRVSRGRVEVDGFQSRIVIGFDGSEGAQAAVDTVESRDWPQQSEVRMIAVTDDLNLASIGRFIPPMTNMLDEVNEFDAQWIEKLASGPLKQLTKKNLSATLHLFRGNPKHVLVEQAIKWSADCIFVGANAVGSPLERYLLGSTSAAVAGRSHCSVEVVRI